MDTTRNTIVMLAAPAAVAAMLCSATAARADVAPEYRIGSFGVQSPSFDEYPTEPGLPTEHRSEMLFKLTPAADPLSDSDELTTVRGEISLNRIDFLRPGEARLQEVHHGFSYSASIDVEQNDTFQSESRLISSRQLGIHYGRLGSVNYSGVDLSVRQFDASEQLAQEDEKELWSLGVTTGRRFSMTGLDPSDPLWTCLLYTSPSPRDS